MPSLEGMEPEMEAVVQVSRRDFIEALKPLKRLSPAGHPEEAIVSYRGGGLQITMTGYSVGFTIDGNWPLEVRVPSWFIIGHAKKPPVIDSIQIAWTADRFRIAQSQVRGTAQAIGSAGISLPIKPTLRQLVEIGLKYEQAQIEKAGLARLAAGAREDMRSRARKAAAHLEPLGINAEDILKMLEEKLSPPSKDRYESRPAQLGRRPRNNTEKNETGGDLFSFVPKSNEPQRPLDGDTIESEADGPFGCICPRYGKPPCSQIPCVTEAKLAARRGEILE